MCIATTTVAAVATAVAATVAAGASTAITLSQISAQKKAAEFQMEQSKKEAKKLEMEAAYERQEGIEDARRQKINSILNMTDSKAKLAGSNIAMSSGLVLNLEDDAKVNSELDALTTQKNSERKARNILDRRDGLYANAALTGFNSRLNTRNSYLQLGSSLFNSGTKSLVSMME